MVKQPIRVRLLDMAGQENCDGEPYDTMVEAAEHIRTLEAMIYHWQIDTNHGTRRGKMNVYEVSANAVASIIVAESSSDARDLFATEAGYQSEIDMVDQIGQASEIIARELATAVEIMESMERNGIDADQDWSIGESIYSLQDWTVVVSGPDFEIMPVSGVGPI